MKRYTSSFVALLTVLGMLAASALPASAAPKQKGKGKPYNKSQNYNKHWKGKGGSAVVVNPFRGGSVVVSPGRRNVVAVYPRYRGPRRAYLVPGGIWLGFTLAAAPYYYDYPVFERYPVEVAVQIELQREGYYRGPIDGIIGRGSQQAIAEFQADNGLRPTGLIDRELLRELDIE
jgi:hypothetical protein